MSGPPGDPFAELVAAQPDQAAQPRGSLGPLSGDAAQAAGGPGSSAGMQADAAGWTHYPVPPAPDPSAAAPLDDAGGAAADGGSGSGGTYPAVPVPLAIPPRVSSITTASSRTTSGALSPDLGASLESPGLPDVSEEGGQPPALRIRVHA